MNPGYKDEYDAVEGDVNDRFDPSSVEFDKDDDTMAATR